MGEKITWWKYVNQDRAFLYLFIVGLVGFVGVNIFDRIDPFYSTAGFVVALAIPLGMMVSIAYFIFYKGWKKYVTNYYSPPSSRLPERKPVTKWEAFLNGWESHTVHERPKTFIKYLAYYPLNWSVLFGLSLFVWLMIKSAGLYHAPIFYFMAFIPFSVMVYHFVDEYYAFQYYISGHRNISAHKLINILWAVVLIDFVTMITLMFI